MVGPPFGAGQRGGFPDDVTPPQPTGFFIVNLTAVLCILNQWRSEMDNQQNPNDVNFVRETVSKVIFAVVVFGAMLFAKFVLGW